MRRPQLPAALTRVASELSHGVEEHGLGIIARNCLLNTWQTTTFLLDDGTTYLITGDIAAMWLRDSSCQVEPYIRFAAADGDVRAVLLGLARRQALYLTTDPYANAFNPAASGHEGFPQDQTQKNPWVFERKFELDSLCYPVRFWWMLWCATGDRLLFTPELHAALAGIVATMRTEQHHERSPYRFQRPGGPAADTLPCAGQGSPVAYTGMVWSGFRPSDDACRFHYLIPAQLFAAHVLRFVVTFAADGFGDAGLAHEAAALRSEILAGVERYGRVEHPEFGPIYAYEVDGLGGYHLMDDANVPSLLSLPYLDVCAKDDPVYCNTRRFVLSPANPYYFIGRTARGIGSPHTPHGYVWPLALIVQALTATDPKEEQELLATLLRSEAGTGLMHESFDPSDPNLYTRPWFGWANALFAEWMLRRLGYAPHADDHRYFNQG